MLFLPFIDVCSVFPQLDDKNISASTSLLFFSRLLSLCSVGYSRASNLCPCLIALCSIEISTTQYSPSLRPGNSLLILPNIFLLQTILSSYKVPSKSIKLSFHSFCCFCVVVQQLFNQIYVRQHHPTTAIPFQTELVQRISIGPTV